ncbi:MAG: helix-turn-helix transcriptional regulator [Candidatus Aminicenantes bacterium]|nr:helix-turn-helix transcriptional regulator [Candidatus Aminicenantes bacterium]
MKDLRSERKRRREEANRLFILTAAEEIFAQRGYTLATMDNIAKKAQFSKATLYHYFGGKRDILFEIILNSFAEAAQGLRKIEEKNISAKKKLDEITRFVLLRFQKKKRLSRVFLMEKSLINTIFHSSPDGHKAFTKEEKKFLDELQLKKSGMVELMRRVFDEGVAAGEFRKMDTRDAAHAFEALLHGFYFTKFWYEKEYSLESATRVIMEFFFYGIRKIEG